MPGKLIQKPLYFTQRKNKERFCFVCPHCGAVIRYEPLKDCYNVYSDLTDPVKEEELADAEVVYCPVEDCIGYSDGIVVRVDTYPYEDWVVYDDITDEDRIPERHEQEDDPKVKAAIVKYYE